jgi:DNA invertase Pin-like site-specific DNA recombinase
MRNAFAYLRVSGKGQLEGDGFTRQLDAIRRYAGAHAIQVLQTFQENGVSGTKDLARRPAFLEMMAALHSGGVDLVLIEKLDRLARELIVQEAIIRDLRGSGIDLISVAEPDLLVDDPTRKLMRQIMGAISEYEKTMTVMKLRGARLRKKASSGRCEGAKRYGEGLGEATVIERMKALRESGMGFDRIAKALNASGIKPRRGTQWWGLTVKKVLSRHDLDRVVPYPHL